MPNVGGALSQRQVAYKEVTGVMLVRNKDHKTVILKSQLFKR